MNWGDLTRNVKSTLLREHTQKGIFALEIPNLSGLEGICVAIMI